MRNRRAALRSAILLLPFAGALWSADDMAYAINSSSQFGIIDLASGAFKSLGISSVPNDQVAGLGAIGGTLYTAEYTGTTLYSVNPASGALNPIGSGSTKIYGIGSTTSGLYAVSTYIDANNATVFNMYWVNPATGATTLIGPLGMGIGPYSAWSLSTGSSTLYIADDSALFSLNTNTGAATLIGINNYIPGAMAYMNGTLYAGIGSCASASCPSIWTLNTTSGAATFVANLANSTALVALAPIAPPPPQVLPHLTLGKGWDAALYFNNSNATPVSFAVDFVADNGAPLTIPSLGSSSSTVNLAPQGTAVLEASGAGTPGAG